MQEFSSEIETIVEDTDEAIRIQEELLDGDKGWVSRFKVYKYGTHRTDCHGSVGFASAK